MNNIIQIKVFITILTIICFLLNSCSSERKPSDIRKYESSWQSLIQHEVPEWLQDAKFGIYAHWGLYSIPAFGREYYGRDLYDKSNRNKIYQHHLKIYGGPEKFGNKEFIPLFKAEKFNPDEWADLIKRSGAKYAGIAVVHHDGFGLWDSDVNKWNVGKMGPKRDIYGELVKSLRKQGLRIIATFHHFRSFNWYLPRNKEHLDAASQKGWDLFDPQYADLYWNEYTSTFDEFIKAWKAKVKEVTDKYQPDVLWFDGGKFRENSSENDVTSFLSYYYNKRLEWGKEVDVLNKFSTSRKFNFPREFGMLTFEGGRDRPDFVNRPWIDDEKIGISSWGYVEGLEYWGGNHLIDGLVDRVSRNGGLLLSLSPKGNGEIPQEQKDILLSIGKWLNVNGEAIYGTRPWKIQAEGSVEKLKGESNSQGHYKWRYENCISEDIRFTRKGNTLYVIVLDWPTNGKLTIKSLSTETKISREGIASISLFGVDSNLKWTRDDKELTIQLPSEKPCEYAFAFKINLNGDMILE